jgi:sugar transferase (PEP-CTERM/EpsH1 system associated)
MASVHDKDILFLAHRVPYPPDKGDRIRTYNILRFLSRRASVHLLCLADEPVSEDVSRHLAGLCRRCLILPLGSRLRLLRGLASFVRGRTITQGAFYSSPFLRALQEWTRETRFHAAMASASSMIPYLRIKELQAIPAIVDLMDVDSQKWYDYAGMRSWPLSWLYRTEGRRLRHIEQDLPGWARAATLVSQAEADLFQSFCPWDQIHSVANGVDLDYFSPLENRPSSEDCVFVGALDYYPNIDAAEWFCREVWPSISQRRPQAKFILVGRRPAAAVQRLADLPGVHLVGQVADVRPFLAKASVVVVPLRIARGLQNKVLEALAMGKAVVASPPALAALQIRPGVHLLAASSAVEWVNGIQTLLENEHYRGELGAAGRKFVEEHHDWDHCLEPLSELLKLNSEVGSFATC